MFSYRDIRCCEIYLAVAEWYPADISDDLICEWDTVRDVVRDVLVHTKPPPAAGEVLAKVRQLIAEGWKIFPGDVTPDARLFDGGLMLDCRPFMLPTLGPTGAPIIEDSPVPPVSAPEIPYSATLCFLAERGSERYEIIDAYEEGFFIVRYIDGQRTHVYPQDDVAMAQRCGEGEWGVPSTLWRGMSCGE